MTRGHGGNEPVEAVSYAANGDFRECHDSVNLAKPLTICSLYSSKHVFSRQPFNTLFNQVRV